MKKTAFEKLRDLTEAERERTSLPLSYLSPAKRAEIIKRREIPVSKGRLEPSSPIKVPPSEGWRRWGIDLHVAPGEMFDEDPDPYGFIIKWGGSPPWPGQIVGFSITGHKDMSHDQMVGWLLEAYRNATHSTFDMKAPTNIIRIAKMSSFSYKELTSRGTFGPHMKAFGADAAVRLFDEAAAFCMTVEKQPVVAIQLMKELKGEVALSGDIRWELFGALK